MTIRSIRHFGLLVLVLLATSMSTGCPSNEITTDASSADASIVDAATQNDQLFDSIGEAPLRRLIERPFFGQMPLNNRFFDPQFSMVTGAGWLQICETCTEGPIRLFLPHTPDEQPLLYLPALSEEKAHCAWGAIKSNAESTDVSIWLGRRAASAQEAQLSGVSATLYLYFQDGTQRAQTLLADSAEPRQVLEDIYWYRVVAEEVTGSIGWSYLYVCDQPAQGLYLAAPRAVAHQESKSGEEDQRLRPPPPRPLTALERNLLKRMEKRKQPVLRSPQPDPS
jgi:hypothetical protein